MAGVGGGVDDGGDGGGGAHAPVRRRGGRAEGAGPRGPRAPSRGPSLFLWRGRLWKVRDVVGHWVETGPWWQEGHVTPGSSGVPGVSGVSGVPGRAPGSDLLSEREVWRVEAGPGRSPPPHGPGLREPGAPGNRDLGNHGLFDLVFDWSRGSWFKSRLCPGLRVTTMNQLAPALAPTAAPLPVPSPLSDHAGRRTGGLRHTRPPTFAYLERSAASLQEAIASEDAGMRYAHALSPRCVPLRRCWRPGPGRRWPQEADPVHSATRGCCSPRSPPSSSSGPPSSPQAPPSGPRPRRARAGPSPSARPTTWSVTPTGSSDWSRSPSGCTGHLPLSSPRARRPPGGVRRMSDPFVHLHVSSGFSLQ